MSEISEEEGISCSFDNDSDVIHNRYPCCLTPSSSPGGEDVVGLIPTGKPSFPSPVSGNIQSPKGIELIATFLTPYSK